jgi:hypothetical protein
MKTIKLVILTCLLMALHAFAQAQFTFTTNNYSITITGYSGSDSTVVIPDTINGYPVTSIGADSFISAGLTSIMISSNVTSIGISAFVGSGLTSVTIGRNVNSIGTAAFADCQSLTMIMVDTNNPVYSSTNGVLFNKNQTTLIQYPIGNSATSYTIPNSVNSIGYEAFFECGNLAGVTLSTSLTGIVDYAFSECKDLTSVTIPGNVTTIEAGVFSGCAQLAAIAVDINNPMYSSVDGVLFSKNQTTLLQYPTGNSARAYTVPNGVTGIGFEAFSECEYLAEVTIPTSVTNIAQYAFYGSSRLESVTIPAGVNSIEDYSFYGCNLTNVSIPQGVVYIGSAAFFGSDLASVTIPSTVTNIGYDAFSYSPRLSGVYFQGNSPDAASALFSGSSLAIVYYLPGTSGWSNTFAGVPAVMLNPPNPAGSLQVTISPAGAIAAGAQWCVDGGLPQPSGATVQGLTVGTHTVTFNTVTNYASPTNLTVTITANATATAAGTYAILEFSFTTNADNTITITGYNWQGRTLIIPDTINGLPVTGIGAGAFLSCGSLTRVTIPASVTSLGDDTFVNCYNLTNVVIGSGVTSIGESSFSDCRSLKNVTIPSNVTNIGSFAFAYCYNLSGVYFQGDAPSASSTVFDDVSYFDNVTIYYLPGTRNWTTNFCGFSTALWFLPNPLILSGQASPGVQSNQFVFTISWATNASVVVDSCTNLINPNWLPMATNTLTGGCAYFSDPQWTNYPNRYYRLRWP